MSNFLVDVFIMSLMRITINLSSNDKLRISMSPNISLGLCLQIIAVKVASFFYKSYNFSEKAFVKYLTIAPTSHVKLCFGRDGFIL